MDSSLSLCPSLACIFCSSLSLFSPFFSVSLCLSVSVVPSPLRLPAFGPLCCPVVSVSVCGLVCVCVCVCARACVGACVGARRTATFMLCMVGQLLIDMGVRVSWSPINEDASHMQCKRTCGQYLDAGVRSWYASAQNFVSAWKYLHVLVTPAQVCVSLSPSLSLSLPLSPSLSLSLPLSPSLSLSLPLPVSLFPLPAFASLRLRLYRQVGFAGNLLPII